MQFLPGFFKTFLSELGAGHAAASFPPPPAPIDLKAGRSLERHTCKHKREVGGEGGEAEREGEGPTHCYAPDSSQQ